MPAHLRSLAILWLFSAGLSAQPMEFYAGPWASALEKAGRENKVIFLDAYTTWCGPCRMMEKQTFTDSTVAAYYNGHFVNVRMDMEKGEGLELARTYRVQAYPTLMFIDPSGEIVHRVAGFHNPELFLDLGRAALDPNRKLQALDEQYANGEREAGFLYTYAYVRMNAMDGSHYPVAQEYLATQEDWSTKKNLEFIFDFAAYVDGPLFRYIVDHKSDFVARYGHTPVIRKIDEVINMANFLNTPDWDQVADLLHQLYPESAEQQLASFRMNYYRQADQMADYTKAALDYYARYPAQDADALTDAAWAFYENVDDQNALKTALAWARQAVKWEDNYYNNDALAALYAKLGKRSKARKTALHAIELAKSSGQDYSLTQELLNSL